MRSWFPHQGSNPCSLQWKHGVPIIEPPRKSLYGLLIESRSLLISCPFLHLLAICISLLFPDNSKHSGPLEMPAWPPPLIPSHSSSVYPVDFLVTVLTINPACLLGVLPLLPASPTLQHLLHSALYCNVPFIISPNYILNSMKSSNPSYSLLYSFDAFFF